ncbi:hypothetical protein GCM10027598_59930 [Amycolatopsis oliviviridis]|uniref:Lipoprotein n=1 Tax=Amycolatopsis oliviviridis TaxID=1471590 RepID=A0ABQ3M7N2_9PSEU|nr:hypothetical protein [Amycolatopsis oliviviridis]GHH28934.1 hypothetical protein GCM10017790_60580 [Amycolatopsis oliviviridis]
MIVKALVFGACLVLAGCTGASGQEPVKEAAGRFLGAVASGDHRSACALLAPRARESWAPETCERGLAAAKVPGGTPEAASVWSEEAQVKTARDTLFLHESSSGWLITGAGCHHRNEQVYDCLVGGP